MRILADPVTPAEEFRYLVTHDLLVIGGIVALVVAITVIPIIVLKKKGRNRP